ncbi:hypothetical protein ANOM_000970 [Aspergillus nomiae NRRL 13137]|uniref:Uncharacterized protein n=1 Tax=Aspergillus nomiae NRRL (strain ATCC 15546 / NRRL 13137 / CBS 260.88 / M93) TaxID=1509407 RepID=A0A0L1JHP4_ASPN3|nr:uncharacterized protein ANOM_000970 [Aspergillus nomiae NRRL 13137]KNG90903.1 hypothetical protein ANOM_000970 [Aspergillus nomiae NRRL 13137]
MENHNTASLVQPENSLQRTINEETLWLSTDENGRTTVHLSSRSHPPSLNAIRLPSGVEEGPPNRTAWLPPNSADDSYRLGLVNLLVESGAKLGVADGVDVGIRGADNVWTAILQDDYRPLLNLLFGGDFKVSNEDFRVWELLNTASVHGHEEIVRFLIERGADVGVSCEHEWTPLHSASSHGHAEIVKLLLENGAEATIVEMTGAVVSVNVANGSGVTPLHMTSNQGHTELVQLLLDHGANVSAVDSRGWTALDLACYGGHIEIVRLLIDNGADLAGADENGCTPLHSAAENGQLEVVELLLARGADINAVDNDGHPPIRCASENGHWEVVRVLVEKGA